MDFPKPRFPGPSLNMTKALLSFQLDQYSCSATIVGPTGSSDGPQGRPIFEESRLIYGRRAGRGLLSFMSSACPYLPQSKRSILAPYFDWILDETIQALDGLPKSLYNANPLAIV